MSKKQILFNLLLLFPLLVFSQETKKVLFLGNSYTAVNNLPVIISALAESSGDVLIYDSNTPGGQTLQQHTQNSVSTNKIMANNWDFVVLQEQSQIPSFPDNYVNTNFYPYAQALNNLITANNPCSETIFYMTWGRKDGDPQNCPSWPPVCTYEGMNNLIADRYVTAANQNQAIVSPVGAVWKNIRENFPAIELYSSDGSHPSLAGSYLAACCFYTAIYRKDPNLINTDYSLPQSDASKIRLAVKTLVYDNLAAWNIGSFDPTANFTYASDQTVVSFTNASNNASDYLWDFGDGATSNLPNPTHTYASSGFYTVTLSSKNCSLSDSFTMTVNVAELGVGENSNVNFSYYPNPVETELNLNYRNIEQIVIVDAAGKIFKPSYISASETIKIDFSQFASGLYFVKVLNNNQWSNFKVIKR